MKRSAMAASAVVLLLTATSARAAEKQPGGDSVTPAIEKFVSSFESAFNRGDAKSLAALWTPGGDLVGVQGERTEGRQQIEKQFEGLFSANKNMKLKMSIVAVHPVGDSAAVVDISAETNPPLQGIPAEPQSTMVLLRRDGRWLIETARDTLAYSPSHYRYLKPLEWMVGQWNDGAAGSEGAHFRSTCDWTTNKNFLIRKYSVGGTDRPAVAGTEVIGWDLRRHCVRSWNFESNGGFGESTWRRDGDRWLIEHSGVLGDGSEASAVHVLAHPDENTVVLKSKERTLNGQPQPEMKELTIHRLPTGEKQPAAEETPLPKTKLP